jgi:hypothetical protein
LVIAEECTTFNDIDNSTYKQEILDASNEGWITCREESSPFRPSVATNRIEALKMALLAGGHNPSATNEQCFDDIPTGDDSWMNPYVCYGLNNNLLVDRDNFLPADTINFAEASKLILRSMTSGSYSEVHTDWYQEYLEKMALYGFKLNASDSINRDYFVYMLRAIEADPNKQPDVQEEEEEEEEEVIEEEKEEEETPTDDTTENNETVVVDDNNSTEDNVTVEVVGETAIGGLEYWFEPYRCFDSTAPKLDLVVENDTKDSANNHILDLEYYTTGGSQSCVDTDGDSHKLAFGTRWRGEGLEFSDLTPSDGDTRYKRVRVTVPSGKVAEIRVAVITTLGKVMVQSLFIDENGNITRSEVTTYGLNRTEIKNPTIIDKIKSAILELESIKVDVDKMVSEARVRKAYSEDGVKSEYDAIKQRLDNAKSKIDDIKQSIDNNIADNDEKVALKSKADEIKRAIDDVKRVVDGYKDNADNSSGALDDIKSAIDGVIAMMRKNGDDALSDGVKYISIKKGRNTISGTIDITKLPDEVHSIWIVEGGNWYGYSPYPQINDLIRDKYLLIKDTIANYKGALVYAVEDTQIETIQDNSGESVEHIYPRGYSIHGTDGAEMSGEDVVCSEPSKLVMVAKVRGDEAMVYVPNREIEGIENFVYLNENDGYYVLCDK